MIPAAPPIIISPSGQTGRANVGRARTTRSRQRCPQPKACQSSSPRNQAGASKEFQNRNRFGDWLAVPRHRRQNRKPSIADEGAHIRKPAQAAGRLPLLRNSEARERQKRRGAENQQERIRPPSGGEHGAATERGEDKADRAPEPNPPVIEGIRARDSEGNGIANRHQSRLCRRGHERRARLARTGAECQSPRRWSRRTQKGVRLDTKQQLATWLRARRCAHQCLCGEGGARCS